MDILFILSGFLMSFSISLLIVLSKPLHTHLSSDTLQGDQKFHQGDVPRIGGIAIFVSLVAAWFFFFPDPVFAKILLASLPVFLTGLWEDIFKSVSSLRRLIAALIAGALFIYLSGYTLTSTDIYLFDVVFAALYLFPILTIIAVAALSNAINIIDGFNGLASGSVVLMALAIAYLGYQSADMLVMQLALLFAAAVGGFFVVNFPRGLLFLGDAGAYLNGYILGVLAILLVERNEQITPLVLLVIFAYPIIELLFSIYRKTLRKGHRPDHPDKVHFHMLVYRKYGRHIGGSFISPNAATGALLMLLPLSGLAVVACLPVTRTTTLLYFIIFALAYLRFYRRLSLRG
jgi:UDP-N-acetylmuramyl pentapeptide phosphotransferase/UDP-N-acetylglucosamine-1-phosphate transferase